MKKKINESELLSKISSLREHIAVIESERQTQEGVWDAIKGAGQKVLGAVTNNPLKTAAAGTAAVGGAAALAPGKPAAAAAPAGTTAPAAGAAAGGKSDPNVMALQQKLIAAGAKIKADGIMGPATRAAQQQFPDVTTQTDAEKAAASGEGAGMVAPAAGAAAGGAAGAAAPAAAPATPAAAPATPAAAPAAASATPAAAPAGMQAVGDDDGNTTITRPDGSTMVVGADGKQIMPGSNPNLPQNKGVLNTISNKLQGKGEFQKPTGFIPPAPAAAAAPAAAPQLANESVGFRNDELNRIVNLVHYR